MIDSFQNSQYTIFIYDKNFTLQKENDTIKIEKYFDISKNQLFSFIFQNNELFIILNQNTFGSAFFGNTVITEPKYLIIKKFNPIFILIQMIYNYKNAEEFKEKNKTSENNEFIDTSAIIQKYEDKLKGLENKTDLFKNNFDSIYKSSMKFVKTIFDKYSKYIELIAEIQKYGKDLGEEKLCVKSCESKLYNFLNSKVNLNSFENKEIEENGAIDENEKDILIKRKIYEKITILEPFLPTDLIKKYLKYKHIDFLKDDEISILSNDSSKNDKKRKNVGQKSNKNKRKGKGKEESNISKNQASITDMFNIKK